MRRLLCIVTRHRRGDVITRAETMRVRTRGRLRNRVVERRVFVCKCHRHARDLDGLEHNRFPLPR